MSIATRQASIAVFEQMLKAFAAVLDKAEAHAQAKKFDLAVYLTLRIRPDMYAFARQVQSACDHAKNGAARLAGVQPPRFEDTEASIAELKARIEKVLAYIATLDAAAIEAGAEREIILPLGPNKFQIRGDNYLLHFLLPNFYFHLTTAYDILRYAGVEIGKRDFLGQVPGFQPV